MTMICRSDAMNAREFFHRVAELRRAQKAYFRTRSGDDLRYAKRLEKEIDDEIARVEAAETERVNGRQKSLF